MTVRLATESDIDACLPLAEQFWIESGYSNTIPYDADSTRDYFNLALNCGLLVIAEKNGEAVGFAAGVTAPSLVNRAYKVGAELAWWIHPDHRGSILAIKTMRLLENQAFASGCSIWSMMLIDTLGGEQVEELYLRSGYLPGERTFIKRTH